MTEEIKIDQTINLEGMLCPIPVVKVSQAIKGMETGHVLAATATDPGVLTDIPAWTRSTGNELVSMTREGKIIKFLVRKVK
jgi:tRNA 2-thiouridine synthesizing protein A